MQWNSFQTPMMPPKELLQVSGDGMLMNVKFVGGIADSTLVCVS
jgi:hypothetical protein